MTGRICCHISSLLSKYRNKGLNSMMISITVVKVTRISWISGNFLMFIRWRLPDSRVISLWTLNFSMTSVDDVSTVGCRPCQPGWWHKRGVNWGSVIRFFSLLSLTATTPTTFMWVHFYAPTFSELFFFFSKAGTFCTQARIASHYPYQEMLHIDI